MNFLMVGAGGALGAMARYGISLIPVKMDFPVLTLLTNFAGAFLIGVIVGMAEHRELSGGSILFWKTGVCGGFTTFSTFSLEALTLFEQGHMFMGTTYVLCSVVLCLLGVFMGRSLAGMAI